MIKNVAFRQLVHNGLTIEGFSRAAVQTFWRIAELKIGFDLGAHPWEFMGTPTWFISHTHLDHVAALPVYVARRRMMKMEPPTIYLPEHAVEPVRHMLRSFSELDRGRMPCELVPVRPGDEIVLSREWVVSSCATRHTVPAMGYVVWERRKKLKPEYQKLTGDQIRDLRQSGCEVSQETRIPRLAYLGDSTPQGLDMNPDMYRAEILISEMTFVAPGHVKEKIHKYGHMHLEDYVERRDRFQNERLIVAHFSTRYNTHQIRRHVEKAFPDMLGGRLYLWT
ncbi:MAG: metal-dependent hydrolase [Planctomycetaceae bacterium]|nr:metal-dependent hydrolase [Planctomycetaceae bacterium]